MKRIFPSFFIILCMIIGSPAAAQSAASSRQGTSGTAHPGDKQGDPPTVPAVRQATGSENDQETAEETLSGNAAITSAEITGPAVLEIFSEPDGAEVYLDYLRFGETPLKTTDLKPGVYYLTLKKSGYYTESDWINIEENSRTVIKVSLKRITGFIHVVPEPKDSQIFLEGTRIEAGVTEVPAGAHILTFRRFGYEEEKASVVVRARRTVTVQVSLEPAAFSLSDPSPTKARLNPENHGSLGRLRFQFRVSAPGSGTVEIRGPDGLSVLSHTMPSFTDWNQTFVWDGRSAGGVPVEDGDYLITVFGTGADGSTRSELQSSVTIDRSAVIRYGTGLSGVSGLLYAPSAETLPSGNWQLSLNAAGRSDTSFGGLFLPAQVFSRVGLTDFAELDLSGLILFSGSGTRGGLATGAVKFRFTENDANSFFRAGAYIRGTVSSIAGTDEFSTATGGAVGFPLEAVVGQMHFVLNPEVSLSPNRVDYRNRQYPSKAWVWGYLRTGFFFDNGDIRTGLSAVFRTIPFSEGFSLELPFQAGFEFHWLIPDSPFQLSLLLSGEFMGTADLGISVGGGFGLQH